MIPVKCFATSETHNTPRTASRKGGSDLSKITYLINKILPLPTFIHSGFELCETIPVNTGLGFEDVDTTKLTADVLPLFSTSKLSWTNDVNIIDFIVEANKVLEPYLIDNYTLKTINTDVDTVVAFEIIGNSEVIFVANYDISATINIDANVNEYKVLLGDTSITLKDNKLKIKLKEFSFVVLVVM